jgi:TolA-binding protein
MMFRRGGYWGGGWGRGGRWSAFQPAGVPWGPQTAGQPNVQPLNEQIEQLQTELAQLRERIEELKGLIPKGEQKS